MTKDVPHIRDYILEITFSDGLVAEVDFRDRIVGRGAVFSPLEDVAFFRQVRVDPDFGTLVWPNDVDFCLEVLYAKAAGRPLPAG
jgi:hypothetical protein